MSSKTPPADLPIHSFASAADFESFLEHEHLTAPGIHLKLAKKSSGIPSITAAQAVEVALCYGWIDGQGNGFDADWYLVRYTPRRAKSIWSQKNVDTVGRLTEEGRMRPAGTAAVDAAKGDGRWNRAYAGSATITVADDFSETLSRSPSAESFFKTLNKTDRYSVLWRVETASSQARAKRIEALVEMLAAGKIPGTKPDAKSVKNVKTTSTPKKQQTRVSKCKEEIKNSNVRTSRRPGLRSNTSTSH